MVGYDFHPTSGVFSIPKPWRDDRKHMRKMDKNPIYIYMYIYCNHNSCIYIHFCIITTKNSDCNLQCYAYKILLPTAIYFSITWNLFGLIHWRRGLQNGKFKHLWPNIIKKCIWNQFRDITLKNLAITEKLKSDTNWCKLNQIKVLR